MENEYWVECPACETETQVLVINDTEPPNYCAMCGTTVQYELVTD